MVFSSIMFLFTFLPIFLLVYFLTPAKFRNTILFLSSLIFYAWGEPKYVLIMIFSTIVDYIHGLLVAKFKKEEKIKLAKLVVASSVTINMSLLAFFKYTDFFITNINSVFGSTIDTLGLALPIGISFYTFQTMSYTIDVYRGEAEPQKNILSFGAYVALFPQLIAGPIVQYKTIAKQLVERKETIDGFSEGVQRFTLGLGKKVLFANNIGMLWDTIKLMDVHTLPVLTAWIGVLAFAFQIYFDFSGYSDMAIGLGRMLGFKFLENFNYPYESKSITEFWRRWHISLGTWFREYLYVPLGGNRCSLPKQIRNIAVVWLFTGIWHGANWNFLLWGVYFGILLTIEKFYLYKHLQKLPKYVAHIYTLVIVAISWVLFAFEDLSAGIEYLKAMFFMQGSLLDSNSLYLLYTNLILLLILGIGSTSLPKKYSIMVLEKIENKLVVEIIKNIVFVGIIIISVAYLIASDYNPFLYWNF